ncbi:MAG: long-chain fatty acid--CoA ligase [Sediminibacterium magnilacihabitans]|jgi:acyl-coenzyme A synthetase/AMP-(fatty) acid ligase|nr:long-chain fatty acid--CoA ligase [Sediminibacterium magnilacihabitans]PQV59461.1 acyl-CoA synthetase (AMP-forming)/AMP-acid ligase II [Sediminibacterium magnilacihabitans]
MQSVDTSARSALLSDRLRNELQLHPHLGAGNFVQIAYNVNPNREVVNIFLHCPFKTFYGEIIKEFSIQTLKETANYYASWYLRQGVKAKDPVGVYFDEGGKYLVHYVALTSIGAIPILTNGAMATSVAALHFKKTGAVGVFTDDARYGDLLKEISDTELLFLVSDNHIENKTKTPLPKDFQFEHDDKDPVMITHSSGTTGVPKAVLLQHAKWFHGIRHLLGLPPAQGINRYLSSLPSSHNASIAYAIHAILNGSELVIMSDRSGVAVASAIEQYKPSTVVSFPQTFVELSELDPDEYDLNSVSIWINSGDAAHETHIRKLVRHGFHYRGEQRIQGSQFIDGLGSSEMGHSSFRIIHTLFTNNYDRCVGLQQKWVEAAILDEKGYEVPQGSVGRLGIKSESITDGYWNDSVLTHRSRLRGYFLTGDLAYKDHLGCFYHVDRVSDAVLTKDGWFYTLQNEELLMKHHPEIADCTIVGIPGVEGKQEPVVFVRLINDEGPDAEEYLEKLNATLHAKGRPLLSKLQWVWENDVPVGITGKVLKQALRQRLNETISC